jgi:hypothetical protein
VVWSSLRVDLTTAFPVSTISGLGNIKRKIWGGSTQTEISDLQVITLRSPRGSVNQISHISGLAARPRLNANLMPNKVIRKQNPTLDALEDDFDT